MSPEHLNQFNANERIIVPWNSLLQARDTNHATFLATNDRIQSAKEAVCLSEPFDLPKRLQSLTEELHLALTTVLEPLLTSFCHNELQSADKCVQLVVMTVESLRSGAGLYDKALSAINNVRCHQKKHLDVLITATSTPSGASAEERADAILDGRSLKSWISAQGRLLSQLESLQLQRGALQADYKRTFCAIVARVKDVFLGRFAPVLSDSEWRQLRKEVLDRIDGEFTSFNRWLGAEASPTVTAELSVSDEDLRLADQRITAKKRSFVVVNFEGKSPSEQASY